MVVLAPPRRSRGSGRSWDRSIHGNSLPDPIPQGLLKRITMWDPEGLPATHPFGHRHDTRQGSSNVVHKKTLSKGKTTCKVSHACTSCR